MKVLELIIKSSDSSLFHVLLEDAKFKNSSYSTVGQKRHCYFNRHLLRGHFVFGAREAKMNINNMGVQSPPQLISCFWASCISNREPAKKSRVANPRYWEVPGLKNQTNKQKNTSKWKGSMRVGERLHLRERWAPHSTICIYNEKKYNHRRRALWSLQSFPSICCNLPACIRQFHGRLVLGLWLGPEPHSLRIRICKMKSAICSPDSLAC